MNQAHTPITTKQLCQAPSTAEQRNPKSPVRASIEHELRTARRNLSIEEVAKLTGVNYEQAKNAIQKIVALCREGRRGYNLSRQHIGKGKQAYRLLKGDPPPPVPTLLPKPEGTVIKTLVAPSFEYDPTTYPWPHLAPPDRPEADAHKAHGSRRGEKVELYSGPRPMCVGTGLGIYGPGSSTSGRARGGT